MKRSIIYILAMVFLFSSCESFLDTKNLMKKDTSNYPESQEEVSALLTGVYRAARDMEMEPNGNNSFVVTEMLSDDRFAGGGPDDLNFSNIEKYKLTDINIFRSTWSNAYKSIFRANMLIEVIDNVTWEGEEALAARANYLGQAYFLRAYSYFYLAKFFGTAPLRLTTETENIPRASADELFAQIASDLKLAIEKMPNTPKVSERGYATKWAAEALMARAFLFYTGYYQKDALPLVEEGQVTKDQVIAYLDDCIANSGYGLYPDFRNLWPYSNELTKRDGYQYSIDNDLSWAKEEGANNEVIFSWHCNANAGWGERTVESNRVNLYFSMREQPEEGIFPFGRGWGFCTVNPQLYSNWPADDVRRKGSIIDVDDSNEMKGYQWGADNQQDESGYWQKKYIAVNVKKEGGGYVNYSKEMYGDAVDDNYQINNTQDLIVIRFADVLLMASELKKDVAPLNLVRERAGLEPLAGYTEEALRQERRWELAFEGLRYYDLQRWGITAEALSKKNGVNIKNANVDAKKDVGNIAQRVKETGGFLPIPDAEIVLSGDVLVQTPGWDY